MVRRQAGSTVSDDAKNDKSDDASDQSDQNTDDKNTKDDSSAKGDDGSSSDGGGLESRIREIVREVVGDLVPAGGGNGRRSADDEDETTRRVQAAMDKIRSDEERENRLKNVEEKVEKIAERPPSRGGFLGKLQRAMWGAEE